MGRITVLPDGEAVAARAAELVAAELRSRRRTRLVLAGGSTPRRSYEMLASEDLPWGRVAILFGDERCVPPDDPDSNYRMAREVLLDRVSPAIVHRIPAELGAEEAASLYEDVVAAAPLDVVLLGIGPDGHTVSLFPGHAALGSEGFVTAVSGAPKPPPMRVSLTLRALRGAARVIILATGAEKADAVRRARTGDVPAGMIPRAEWLLSADAAGGAGL